MMIVCHKNSATGSYLWRDKHLACG